MKQRLFSKTISIRGCVYLWNDSQVIKLTKIINDTVLLYSSYRQQFTMYAYGDKDILVGLCKYLTSRKILN